MLISTLVDERWVEEVRTRRRTERSEDHPGAASSDRGRSLSSERMEADYEKLEGRARSSRKKRKETVRRQIRGKR